MNTEVIDIAGYKSSQFEIKWEMIKLLGENAVEEEAALRKPEGFGKLWKMVNGEKKLVETPKLNILRTMTLKQLSHHRGKPGVCFRPAPIPVPASYRPIADEN